MTEAISDQFCPVKPPMVAALLGDSSVSHLSDEPVCYQDRMSEVHSRSYALMAVGS